MLKQNINESFTPILYHFCSLKAAFYIVKHNAFFLTSIYDSISEKDYNKDKMYFMSFTRSYNGNIGYVGNKNGMISTTLNNDGRKTEADIDLSEYRVRIEVDGRILGYNNKANTVNFLGNERGGKSVTDTVGNRQQEDRLISDKPYIENAIKFIRAIYIYDQEIPNLTKKSKFIGKTTKYNRIAEKRGKIIYMMEKLGGNVFVFNNWDAFNNPTLGKNIDLAIERGFAIDAEDLINSNKGFEYQETKINDIQFPNKAITTTAKIFSWLRYHDNSFSPQDELNRFDDKGLVKPVIGQIITQMNDLLYNFKNASFVNSFAQKSTMLMNQLKNNLTGDYKVFYPPIAQVINYYIKSRGYIDFNDVIKDKKKLRPLQSQLIEPQKIVSNESKNKIKDIITETINSFILLKENKIVTFGGSTDPKYGWAVFVCGAPGSGKSTAAKSHMLIQGKVLTPDYFREAYADMLNVKNKDMVYDLRNSKDKVAINKMLGLDKKGEGNVFSQQIYNIRDANKGTSTLPNLIFDTIGINTKTIDFYFKTLKAMGNYKVSVVWVATNRDVAFVNNMGRDRVIGDSSFHRSHNRMAGYDLTTSTQSIQGLLNKHSKEINEAWIIFNSSFDDINGERIQRRPNDVENKSNVVKLEKINGTFQIPKLFGTDSKKPFLGGKQNVSLDDILGDKVEFNGKGMYARPKNYPTVSQAAKNVTNDNPYPLKNTEVEYNKSNLEKEFNRKINRLKQGKNAINHSSMI